MAHLNFPQPGDKKRLSIASMRDARNAKLNGTGLSSRTVKGFFFPAQAKCDSTAKCNKNVKNVCDSDSGEALPICAGGPTTLDNLALAGVSCSLRKGAKTEATDPDSGKKVLIFNPRTDRWDGHFRWNDVQVVGLTVTGRATIQLLRLNRPLVLALREEEKLRHGIGRFDLVRDK
jgi:hypothetical protein